MSRIFKPRNCIICKKEFTPINAKAAKFCSWQCKLETKFDKSGGRRACWPFIGNKLPAGYGVVQVDNLRREYSHRAVWIKKHGPIPPGMEVCHHCDNPPCGNDRHLFMGTKSDNMRDCIAKGRGRWGKGDSEEEKKKMSRFMKRLRKKKKWGVRDPITGQWI